MTSSPPLSGTAVAATSDLRPARPRQRIALYSHDTVGLGHTRRQLAIAHALSAHRPEADLLMLTGNPEATLLPVPARTDLVTLPTVTKDAAGRYVPRRLGSGLDQVLSVRRAVLTAALTSFAPDLLIVDKVPSGLAGELSDALEALSDTCRIVLGLREVLDDPATTRAEWRRDRTEEVIARYYDEVWVHGDVEVFDPAHEYGWQASTRARTVPLGYLGHLDDRSDRCDPGTGGPRPVPGSPSRPYVLCQIGGGADGHALARTFLQAPLPTGHDGLVLAGPYLPHEHRRELETLAADPAHRGRMRVLPFTDRPQDLLASAAAVVSMAGYNSTVEILSTAVPALLVPRIRPRREQLIRARALAARGAVDVLEPDDLTAHAVGRWTARATATTGPGPATTDSEPATTPSPQRIGRASIDLAGLTALIHRTDDLIGVPSHAA